MKRTTWPGARLVGAVLLAALLVAAVTVPAAVWPDSYPAALAAGLAVAIAVAAVGLLAILLSWRSRERELTASELEAVRTAVPVAVVAVDVNGAVLHWNAGAERLYGYDAEEMAGRPLSVLEGENGDGVLEAVREAQQFADSEAVHYTKDGTEISVSVTVAPISGARGETVGAVLTATDVSELRRALARLAEVKAKYRSLTDLLPLVTYAHPVGERASMLHVSPQVQALLGYAPDEWLAQPELFSRLLHPDDRERVSHEVEAVIASGQPFVSEYRLLSRAGRVIWVHDEAVTVRDAHGDPLYVQGFLLDVGERRRAEEEREHLLAVERAATENSMGKQRRLDFLAQAAGVLGSSLDFEATLRRMAELAVQDFADWCVVELVDEEGVPSRLTVARREPGTTPMTEPVPDPAPEVQEVVRSGRALLAESRICVPLLARGRAVGALMFLMTSPGRTYGADELSLAESLARVAALAVDCGHLHREVEDRADAARVLAHVGDGVFLVDRAGVIRLWNPAAEVITGLPADAMVGRSAGDAIPDWRAVAERIPVAASLDPVHAETLPVETERGERWISISGVEFFGGTVYAFRDLTNQRRLEELKTEFVATASHELRTPLAAVYGAAQTLRRHDFALDEAGRERFVSLIVDESERLGRIVNQILLANQLDAGRLDVATEPFDPTDLMERVVEAVRTHTPPGTRIEVVAPEPVPAVAADRDRVRQILVNLVENAIKYSPDGGVIQLGVEPTASMVRFRVRDEGLGIPPAEQARIFEKFYRLDADMTRGVGGTGLGLYICIELVERMDGRIWVESSAGEGSTFFFDLPAEETHSPSVLAPDGREAQHD